MKRRNLPNTRLRKKSRSNKKDPLHAYHKHEVEQSQTISKAKLCLMELTNQPLTEPAIQFNEGGFTRWDSLQEYQTFSPTLKRHPTPTKTIEAKVVSGRIRSRTQMERVETHEKKPETKHFWPATTVVNPHHKANQGALGREMNTGIQKGRALKQRVITPNATIREQYSFVLPRSIASSKRIRLKEYANFYRPSPLGFQRTKKIEELLATKLHTTTEDRVREMDRLHSVHHRSIRQSKYDVLFRAHKQRRPLEKILQVHQRANHTPPVQLTTQTRSFSKSPNNKRT